MLPIELLHICADYLHCELVPEGDSYKLVLKPCKYFEVLTDENGKPFVVPCATM